MAGALWMLSKEGVAAEPPSAAPAVSHDDVIFAAQGRIEGLNEAIQIGAAASGLLDTMPYQEGDVVEKGRVIAHIDCRPLESERRISLAELDAAAASHQRLLRGSRTEERLEAEANTAAAEAALERAKQHYDRFDALLQKAVTPPEDRDQALRDFQVAEQQHNAVVQRETLVKADPL